jgi:hypothetical protein
MHCGRMHINFECHLVGDIDQVYSITFLQAIDLWGRWLGIGITTSQFPIVISSPAVDTTIRYCSACMSIRRSEGNYPWKQAIRTVSDSSSISSSHCMLFLWLYIFATSAVRRYRFCSSNTIAASLPSTAYFPAVQALQLVEPVPTRQKKETSLSAMLDR